jgi:ubiquinone/menaquinone biosynthesis C-methylase UbiE
MQAQLEQIRDQQKETWNKFSPGWKKWDDLTMEFLKPMGDEIIRQLQLKPTDLVLDIAAGTGEPGLTIAGKVTSGRVIITDLAEGMLQVADENAAKKGLTNVETKVCDVSVLPFADNTFDAISCRFGYMFFPDMELATKEIFRVLKPGGRFATTVWFSPDRNLWATTTLSVVNKHLELPKPPAGAPGLYRCAERGLVSGLFQSAGFKNVSEGEVKTKLQVASIDEYWNFMTDVVAPVVAALSKADEATKTKVKNEVFEAVKQKYADGNIGIDGSALIICGQK